ncbi:MAG: hypothetical protein IKJ68_10640 [Clostridia bacterium]|nr:hypothetical protein [Clostridia bacterium]
MYKAGEINHKTVRAINAFSAKTGFDIEFVEEIEGGHNASFNTKTGVLQISRNSKKPFVSAAIHETVHAIRSVDTGSYNQLKDVVYSVLSKNNEAYKGVWSEMYSLYKNEATDSDGNLNKDYISEELTAEVVSQLLTDEAFVNEMAKTDRNFVQKIYDIILDFFDKMMGRYIDVEKVGSAKMDAAVKQLQSEFDSIKKMYKKALANTEAKRGVNMTLPKKGEVMHSDTKKSKSVEKNNRIKYNINGIDLSKSEKQKVKAMINGFWRRDSKNLDVLRTVVVPIKDKLFMYVYKAYDYDSSVVMMRIKLEKTDDSIEKIIHKGLNNGKVDEIASVLDEYAKITASRRSGNSSDYNSAERRKTSDGDGRLYKRQLSGQHINELGEVVGESGIDSRSGEDVKLSKSPVADPTENIEPPQEQTMSERSAASFELKAEVRRKLNEHIEKYGTLEKGVNPVRDVDLPKKTSDDRYVRRGTRTVIESARVTDEVAQKLTEEIANGEFWTTYERSGDKKAQETAQQRLEHEGFDKLLSEMRLILYFKTAFSVGC